MLNIIHTHKCSQDTKRTAYLFKSALHKCWPNELNTIFKTTPQIFNDKYRAKTSNAQLCTHYLAKILIKIEILKKKCWEPHRICLLNSTANPAHFHQNWAELAVLFSRQILNGSQDFFFSVILT